MRDWATKNGRKVSARGTNLPDVTEAYNKANA
ncbi:Lsr2 family DNA-binding protein [Nocardia ninae]